MAPIASPPKILVFDSGAGGLSITQKILERAPGVNIIFGADNAFFPYGNKEDGALLQHIIKQVDFWYRTIEPDLVVLACNTASTLALDALRANIPRPIVGVVPAIKPASASSKRGVIGVLATSATVSRDYTQLLIEEFADEKKVILHGSDTLVELAERKVGSGTFDLNALKTELDGLFSRPGGSEIDTVVLACTHFPLIKEEMKQVYPDNNIQWIDSGDAVANRVVSLIEADFAWKDNPPTIDILFSNHQLSSESLKEKFLSYLTDGGQREF